MLSYITLEKHEVVEIGEARSQLILNDSCMAETDRTLNFSVRILKTIAL